MLAVSPIPAFRDNYIWAIRLPESQPRFAIVDPGDAQPVYRFLEQTEGSLEAILVTHHHGDHVGGIRELLRHHRVPVYGPRAESIPGCSHPLDAGDLVHLAGERIRFRVMAVPGHTRGHIAYVGDDALFCGDTLFAGGCGRLFEGTPAQMHESLTRLAALPGHLRVYCAHEYTVANLRFAAQVDPDNAVLAARRTEVDRLRARGEPTVPSLLALEHASNPFLRTHAPALQSAAATYRGHRPTDPAETFAALREWKDGF